MDKLTLKTWDEWEHEGCHVIKGQKAVAYNKHNKALFSERQVTRTTYRDGYGYDYTRDQAEMQYKEDKPHTVYYADGSGYVDFGGPCGPLYFDRNGNT